MGNGKIRGQWKGILSPLSYHTEARKVWPVQSQQQKMISLKVFHLSIKKLLSLFPVFHFFNAATEIPCDKVVSSSKNHPVKSPFPNVMGLNTDFSVRIPLLTVPHTMTADSFWFAIKVVTLNLRNLVPSICSWCPYHWTYLWCSVRFLQHSLGLLTPQLAAFLRIPFKMHVWLGLPHVVKENSVAD